MHPSRTTTFSSITTSSSIIEEYITDPESIQTFLPIVTELGTSIGRATFAFRTTFIPIVEKWPILIGPISALKTALYHTVAHFETLTSPTNVAFGATQAS